MMSKVLYLNTRHSLPFRVNNSADEREGCAVSCAETLSISALSRVFRYVSKVILHRDGNYGTCFELSHPDVVLEKASFENYKLLNLGKILRLYFDDHCYFDLYLNTANPLVNSDLFNSVVLNLLEYEVTLNKSAVLTPGS